MHITSLYCLLVLVGQNGLLSIYFNEYYDTSEVPLEGLDEFNEPNCHHIGSRCFQSEQCCGPATCVLPAWSPTSVCLVPGYKEDNRLQAISARDPIRKEDVLYLRNMYNTTFFDFLLNDSSSPVPDHDSTVRVLNETCDEMELTDLTKESNDSINNVSFEFSLSSKDLVPVTDSTSTNDSTIDTVQIASKISSKSKEGHGLQLPDNKISNDLNTIEELKTDFLRRFKFMILNRNLKKAQPNASDVVKELKTVGDIMHTVKLLTDKLNQLTYNARGVESNSVDENTSIEQLGSSEIVLPPPTMVFMNTSKMSKKHSKWNIVKAFFLRKQHNNVVPPRSSNNTQKINLEAILNETEIKNNTTQRGENRRSNATLFSILRDLYSRRKEKKIPKLFLGHKGSVTSSSNENMHELSENGIESMKIKLPYQINNINNDNYYKNADDIVKPLYTPYPLSRKSVTRMTSEINQHHTTYELVNDTTTIRNLMTSLRRWFVFPIKANISKSITNETNMNNKTKLISSLSQFPVPLDEYHSKMNSKTPITNDNADLFHRVTAAIDESNPSDFDYSENNDDLYNNSYVFMIKRENKTNAKPGSKWKSVLHLFHVLRVPHNQRKTSNSDKIATEEFVGSATDRSNINNSSESYPPERIIRIPEHLMPEALEAMQSNWTRRLFLEDSFEEYEELTST